MVIDGAYLVVFKKYFFDLFVFASLAVADIPNRVGVSTPALL